MEIKFDHNSRVGKLYTDIKNEYLKRFGTEEKFYNEINQGCVDSFMLIPAELNDPLKVDSCEVFEIAYKYKEFHPYLVKHGYPLPIGMNDYDPKTKIDDKLRQEIDSLINKVESELLTEGLIPGTNDYVCKASRRIYDWGITRLAFKKDCDVESIDWEAMDQKCGACTEASAIMY